MNEKIQNMSKDELVKYSIEINEQLEELKKLYEPFVGKSIDSIPEEDVQNLIKISSSVQKLIVAKIEIRRTAYYKYNTFIM